MDNSKPFNGKVVTVTGAAHGIGLATVNWLVSRGATVCMADIAKSALEKAAEKVSQQFPDAKLTHTAVNVKDAKSVQTWIEQAKETFGRIDGCVNNAGKLYGLFLDPALVLFHHSLTCLQEW
jgi:NADP-dependent 3-hydroxy acid dehydrogenase YdfG